LFPHWEVNLGPHGDTSPHESMCIQVEFPTGIEKHVHVHTHTHTHIYQFSEDAKKMTNNWKIMKK